ncbi:MAG: hypothetical protein LAT78_00360 [Roseinatronobacter sp.]|nr:hypothetical protein [Roseinatronobacter sp.]
MVEPAPQRNQPVHEGKRASVGADVLCLALDFPAGLMHKGATSTVP